MANIQLPTGKTINISLYEFLFKIKDDEVDLFFQACIADDLGDFIDDPFSNKGRKGKIIEEEQEKIEEVDLKNLKDESFELDSDE